MWEVSMETSQTVDMALRTLILLELREQLLATDIGAALKASRTSTMRVLASLHARGFVSRTESGEFRLGPALVPAAMATPSELAVAAAPHVQELAHRLGETIVVTEPMGADGVAVAQHGGQQGSLRVTHELGTRRPLSRGASGLAILAFADADDPRRQAVPSSTLRRVRAERVAWSESEVQHGMVGLAVPILFTPNSKPIGSLAAVAPRERGGGLHQHVALLRDTAQIIAKSHRAAVETASHRDELRQ